MENASLGEEEKLAAFRSLSDSVPDGILASSERKLRRAVCNNPGMALAISAAIGVILACLIKRR
jgi:ElaB/YqjD/DUF883 family membrane-anchored ribosome-binding protein